MLDSNIPERLKNMVLAKQGEIIELAKQQVYVDCTSTLLSETQRRAESFLQDLSQGSKSFILEYKPASPSKGVINSVVTIEEMVKVYQPFSSAISILVDSQFFASGYHNLQAARGMTQLPLVAKDVTFGAEQIQMSQQCGADIVLLMLSVLSDELYLRLYHYAKSLGLAVITEVASLDECKRVNFLPVDCIGINHRNFSDLSIDMSKTHSLFKAIKHDVPIIAESGIGAFDDFAQISGQVSGYLIGSSMMAAACPRHQLRQMLFTSIKVCGVTKLEQAEKLQQLGASYIGIIRADESPRKLSDLQTILRITECCQRVVAVYVNEAIENIVNDIAVCGFSAVQLHGEEDESYIKELKQKLPTSIEIWKTLKVSQVNDSFLDILLNLGVKVLVDNHSKNQRGGTGQKFNWSLIPKQYRSKVRLAGGVSITNINEALDLGFRQFDINSSIESLPGEKDSKKFEQLLAQVVRFRGSNHV